MQYTASKVYSLLTHRVEQAPHSWPTDREQVLWPVLDSTQVERGELSKTQHRDPNLQHYNINN